MQVQTYIPPRLLRGLLPEQLLHTYAFWQDGGASSNLYGYVYKRRHTLGNFKRRSILRVILTPAPSNPKSKPQAYKFVNALVRRYWVYPRGEIKPQSKPSGSSNGQSNGSDGPMSWTTASYMDQLESTLAHEQPMTLLNLLHAKSKTPLARLRSLFSRLDSLAHVLVWSSDDVRSVGDVARVSTIELPRLNLSFTVSERSGGDGDGASEVGGAVIRSRQLQGLTVSDQRPSEILQALTSGIPNHILMKVGEGGALGEGQRGIGL